MATVKIGDQRFGLEAVEDLTVEDGIAVEKAYGKTFDQWLRDMRSGSLQAIRVFVWILRRLNGEAGLRVDDVNFKLKELMSDDPDTKKESENSDTEVVPGGATAEFDPANPTPAVDQSTAVESSTSEPSATSTESDLGSSAV